MRSPGSIASRQAFPNLFGNYLRLAHLDREAAKSAIVGPVERYNEPRRRSRAHVGRARSRRGRARRGRCRSRRSRPDRPRRGRPGTETDDRIEAPYLQLVMRPAVGGRGGSRLVHAPHLDARDAGRSRGDRPRASRRGARAPDARAEGHRGRGLQPPGDASGTKIAHAVPDLARYAGVPETELEPVVATLARERILRPAAADGGAPRYEIYHDVLGEAVLAWRQLTRPNASWLRSASELRCAIDACSPWSGSAGCCSR